MLSYDICRKLKETGYPQDRTAAKFMCFQRADGSWTPALFADEYAFSTDIDWAACPNSDELIAAIQARWPGAKWLGVMHAAKYGQWRARATVDSQQWIHGHGDTPAAALAALYIALDGAEHA